MARQRYDVFNIREAKTKTGDSSFWTRIGVAFVNRDGSINVKLELMPLNGELHLRVAKPKADQPPVDTAAEAPTP